MSVSHIEYDYDDAVNKIPFNVLYHSVEKHYKSYGIPFKKGTNYVLTGDITPYDNKDLSDILIMTGGSSNHVVTAISCIFSFVREFPHSPVLFIDFGITPEEKCLIELCFQLIHEYHEAMGRSIPLYFRTVNWDHFPDWMHITKAMNHGGYTWKPIVIADAFYQWKGIVMWNDAGNYAREGYQRAFNAVYKEGIYLPYDHARLDLKLHIDCYNFLIDHHFAKPFDRNVTSGRAIFMLFDYRNSVCRDNIMVPWIQCAYTRKCMTLKNVTKAYHLPEQSVLTILIRENNLTLSCTRKNNYYPFIWRDNDRYLRVIPNKQLQFDIASVNAVTGRNYSQNMFTKCISYCVS